jgi:predicted DNA-binding ribbon-helix-helix protein
VRIEGAFIVNKISNPTMKSQLRKRSVVIDGRKTSASVEDDFWDSLKEIAKERHQSLADLLVQINAERKTANLSSAIRLYVLGYYQYLDPSPDQLAENE